MRTNSQQTFKINQDTKSGTKTSIAV